MNTIMTFEEWKERYIQAVTPEMRAAIFQLHGITENASQSEIDTIIKSEYDTYVTMRQAAGEKL